MPPLDDSAMQLTTTSSLLTAFQSLRFQNARAISRIADDLGITPTDFRAVVYITSNADATPKVLSDYLDLTTGAMTSLLDRLEAAGLVRRQPNPRDRRSVILVSTPAGADVVAEVTIQYTRAFDAAVRPEHAEIVLATFERLANELGAMQVAPLRV